MMPPIVHESRHQGRADLPLPALAPPHAQHPPAGELRRPPSAAHEGALGALPPPYGRSGDIRPVRPFTVGTVTGRGPGGGMPDVVPPMLPSQGDLADGERGGDWAVEFAWA